MKAAAVPSAPTAEEGRRAILAAVKHFANPAGGGGMSPLMRRARERWAARFLLCATSDSELIGPASDDAQHAEILLLEAPAIDAAGLALKLACLVGELLSDLDTNPRGVNQLALAAGSLADAVVLAGGPIALPRGAKEGIKGDDTATAAEWLARQAVNWRE